MPCSRSVGSTLKDIPQETDADSETTVYDASGDVQLYVGQKHCFQLSSKQLELAGQPFKDLISSGRDLLNAIYLKDDDPETWSLLLRIVHLRISDLPQSLTLQELYSLTCFCRKYQAHGLFQPFLSKWIGRLTRKQLDPDQTEWIEIAWEFGLAFIFQPWLEHLCRTSAKNADEEIVYGERRLAELFPDACKEEMGKSIV